MDRWRLATPRPVDSGCGCCWRASQRQKPFGGGITKAKGVFDRGDLVAVCDPKGQEIGRGLCNYSATDVAKIAGCKSSEIPDILGYRGRDEVVHADDLVIDQKSDATTAESKTIG